ncbi:uncharacterized protein LOC120352748 [Nilaparvata lugens]|uniref:uncharacterized protein LOC120352748 n=1 Tax=Nilaparvata lugens TaxID=108931 RepID=UPI00193DDD3F|nr:uncharacterized protein LOC120352748 [Nilaparvata lugens]
MRSQICSIYPELANFTDYIHHQGDFTLVKWFLKARTELIRLNKYSFSQAVKICSLCNMKEEEDVPHFIARCPILSEIRRRQLNNSILTTQELKSRLNGQDWEAVGRYCKEAWQYRYSLVQEYNF